MARKDVELVFRAKDQAGKVVDNLASTIDELVKGFGGLPQGSAKASSALDKLGAALGGLDKSLKGLSGVDAIKGKLNDATKAFESQSAAIGKTTTDLNEYQKQAAEAAARTADLRAKAEAAAVAQTKQATAADKAKIAEAGLKEQLRETNSERDKAVRAVPRLTTTIANQSARVAEAQDRFNRLGAEIAAADKPTATLQKRFEAAGVSLDKAKTKLAGFEAGLIASSGTVDRTAAELVQLNAAVIVAAASTEREVKAAKAAATAHTELGAAVKASVADERRLQGILDETNVALTEQVADLKRAEGAMDSFGTAEAQAAAQQAKLASTIRSILLPEYRRLTEAQAASSVEQQKQQATIRDLANEIDRVGVPTRQMVEGLNNAKVAAQAAKQEQIEYTATLAQVRNALRQAQAGSISYAQATQRITQATTTLKGSLATIAATRADSTITQVAVAANKVAPAMGTAAGKTSQFEKELKRLAGSGRESLSMFQRLRGEVLALAASYVGVFAAVEGLKKVVDVTGQLQGATNRLNVVMGGDTKRTNQEVDFLRRNAERLGIQFGDLADEYSKFAVATKGTNLEGEKTRKIFISVAEAARVNRSSAEDMSGVFVALTQIVSKGAVQMEELRQQLGDRMPGALQLMADGLGVTTAQLIKMMEQGQVTSDALVGFAEQLDKKFGPGLAKALSEVTAEQGRLNDAIFQGALKVGQGGFMEAYTNLLRKLNDAFRSGAADTFFAKLSVGLARTADLIGILIDNFDLLVIAGSAFVGIKVAGQIPAMVASLVKLRATVLGLGATMAGAAAGTTALGAASGTAAASVGLLGGALRLLLSSTGIGLLVTLVATGIGVWATRTDEATAALNEHEKIVDDIKNAYDAAGGSVAAWADASIAASKTQVEENLRKRIELLQEIRDKASAPEDAFGLDTKGTVAAIKAAVDAFKLGTLSATEFKAEIERIASTDDSLSTGIVIGLQSIADAAATQEQKVAEASAALDVMNHSATEATAATLGLSKAQDNVAAAAEESAQKQKTYTENLNILKEAIPALNAELERLNALAKLDDAFSHILENAADIGQLTDAVRLLNQATAEVNGKYGTGVLAGVPEGMAQTLALLKSKEGFQPTAKYDVNAYRGGYGSDEITLADGSVKKITEGMSITMAEAERDLQRRAMNFQSDIIKRIGQGSFDSFSGQQQAVLTSLAYNYGALPERIAKVIDNGGSVSEIAAAIDALKNDNPEQGKPNFARRQEEAQLFATGGSLDPEAQIKANETIIEQGQKKVAAQKEFLDGQLAEMANSEFQVKMGEMEAAGQGRQAAILTAIRDAEIEYKKQGLELDDATRASIEKTTGLLYDQKNAGAEAKTERAGVAAQEKIINDLLAARTALLQAIKAAESNGDSVALETAKTQLEGVNAELEKAIEQGIAMHQAIGGPGADASIAKLEALKLKTSETAQQMLIDWKQVGDMFASGLVNAIDNFFQAVANGENVADAAAQAFLQFAADFLREIAKMILKQLILNAISSFFGGGAGAGIMHSGGVVGGTRNRSRTVNPAVFATATRMHTGGIAGLKPNEVPTVLEKGEEVLPTTDPRHQANGGGQATGDGGSNLNIKSVLVLDPNMIPEAMSSSSGERVTLAHIRANATTIKSALGLT